MYYITQGIIILLHRETCTYIKEIDEDTFLSEVSFFTSLPRKVSARSKSFTNVLILQKEDFLDLIENTTRNFEIFQQIGKQIKEQGDLSIIGVQCYVCQQLGHMSVDC